jgi:hypothetical protein
MLCLVIIFSVISDVFYVPTVAQAQTANQSGLDVDVIQDCANLTEDQEAPDPGNVFPPGFNFIAPFVVGLPFGNIDWKINSFAEFLNTMGFLGSNATGPATLQIQSGTYSANEGDPIEMQADARNFKTTQDHLDFAWWEVRKTDDGEQRVSLNGVVAGGEPFAKSDTPISDGTRCGVMTRKPKIDNDHDGMDDQWERRYTKDASGLNANEDPDSDGYVANSFQQNDTGATFRIVSNSQSFNGRKFGTGDGSFPNLEEYVWGTNPLDADSDDDGFPDEADVAGIGQTHLSYQPTEVAGLSETIEVDTMGETFLAGKDENLVTQILGYRVDLPVLLLQNFSVLLSSDNTSPQLDQSFQVQAGVNGTNAKPGNLQYAWNITKNQTKIPVNESDSPCHLFSYGNIVECSFSAQEATAGGKIVFNVEAFDPQLGLRAKDTLNITIGGSIILTSNPTIVPQYPIDQTGQNPVAPAGNETLGERWVELSAVPAQGEPSDYNFDWYVDQEKMTETCATRALTFTGKAQPQGVTLCGVGTYLLYYHADKENTHVYKVNVKVTNKRSGETVADEDLSVYTDPVSSAYPGQGGGNGTNLIQLQSTSVQPNTLVTVRAANYEASTSNSYQYIWTVDGQVVSDSGQRILRFTAQPDKTHYDIQLDVIERNKQRVISQEKAVASLNVLPSNKFQDWKESRLATVKTAFYPFYHTMAGNTSLFLVLGGLTLVVSVYFLDKKERTA